MIDNKLKELDFTSTEINELLIKSKNSRNISLMLDIILNNSNKETIKDLILLILEIDPINPISVNVKDLCKVIGLSVRQINKLRKEGKIPSILISGTENKTGRKTYLYEIKKVKEALSIK